MEFCQSGGGGIFYIIEPSESFIFIQKNCTIFIKKKKKNISSVWIVIIVLSLGKII